MFRYALTIEYHGAPFVGWSRQPNQHSVQGCIEAALEKIDRRTQTIAVAGRTDAGVHAKGQVAHCDMLKEWVPTQLMGALNHHLRPNPIAIVDCRAVSLEWHARFSARQRCYLYRILSRVSPATHDGSLVWQIHHALDLDRMRAAAQYLIGRHDFTTFRSSVCQSASPIKTIDVINIARVPAWSGTEVHIEVKARSFMHNQVRSIVGTLERVGAGRWAPEQVRQALAQRDRTACGPVAPAKGLHLMSVRYDLDCFEGT